MVNFASISRLSTYIVALPLTFTLTLLPPAQAQNPNPGQAVDAEPTQPDLSDPNNLRPLTQSNSILSQQGGKRLMTEALSAASSQNYAVAVKKLQDARQVFNQLSNFYQQLNTSFSAIDNRIADSQRRKAVEAADMRDQATYQLALVHRAQNQSELAVPLLIQIIRSQNPTRDLGKKAYQQLFEIGFVDAPFSGTVGSQPTPPRTPTVPTSQATPTTPTPQTIPTPPKK
ncbi:MAG TPA: hypothetical protein V6D15_04830 [Oculatellaceae cyanobacterium]